MIKNKREIQITAVLHAVKTGFGKSMIEVWKLQRETYSNTPEQKKSE